MPDWTVYVRAPDMTLAGQVDDYQKLEMVQRFNDVGTWLLDVDAGIRQAPFLMLNGAGLVVTADGTVVFSGPVKRRERDFAGDHNRLRVSGLDDSEVLTRRLASPQPATAAPPYNSQGYDVRTGTCSTILGQYVNVNAGPGAIGPRAIPGLTLAADPGLGTSITGRARWQPLPELLQGLALAGGGLGYRVLQVGTGIQFSVYAVVDRTTSVIFSTDLGNLEAFAWSEEAPDTNYVYVGGGGEDTARTVYEGQDSASIGRWGRIESFRDRRDTTVAAELAQAAIDELQKSAGQTSMAITPIDLPQMAYLTHYGLGDKVTAVMDGVPVQQVIREVKVTLDENGAFVVPTIGTPGRQDLLGIFDRLREAEARLVTLERR